MKSIKRIFIAFFLLSVVNTVIAQTTTNTYKTGVGVRFGGLTTGLTVKSFVNPSSAIEGILSFGSQSFVITGLYEKHTPIATAPGLSWLVGGGGHFGFFRYGGRYYYWLYTDRGVVYVREHGMSTAVAGLDFILGMDYKFPNAPFNVGLDMKPFVDFYHGGVAGYFDGALSVRFVF